MLAPLILGRRRPREELALVAEECQRAGVGIEAQHVAVADFAIGPPSTASGVTWMAAGTLPDAPDMRPSVTSATLNARPCRTLSAGVRLCSSGMPMALGPAKRTTAMKSWLSSPALKAACSPCWLWKHARRRLDDRDARALPPRP